MDEDMFSRASHSFASDLQRATQQAQQRRNETERREAVRTAREEQHRSRLGQMQKHRRYMTEGPPNTAKTLDGADAIYRKTFPKYAKHGSGRETGSAEGAPWRVFLPSSALHEITLRTGENLPEVMVFHLYAVELRREAYAVVEEFTGDEEHILLSKDLFEYFVSDEKMGPASPRSRLSEGSSRTISLNTPVVVTLVDLPKATGVKLALDCPEFFSERFDQDDLSAFLQEAFSRVLVLFCGQTLQLQASSFSESYETMEAKILMLIPEAGALLIRDCDLAVDIVMEKKSRRLVCNSNPIVQLGQSISQKVFRGSPSYQQRVPIPRSLLTEEGAGNGGIRVKLTSESNMETESSEPSICNLFVSWSPLKDSNLYSYYYADLSGRQEKEIFIDYEHLKRAFIASPPTSGPRANALLVGVTLECGEKVAFSLTVNWEKEVAGVLSSTQAKEEKTKSAGQDLENSTLCCTCHCWVPVYNMALHQIHCSRFLQTCKECGKVMHKDNMETHRHCSRCGGVFEGANTLEEVRRREGISVLWLAESSNAEWWLFVVQHMILEHRNFTCLCGAVFERSVMTKHFSEKCPKRLIRCRFCELIVAAGPSVGLSDWDKYLQLLPHEVACGAKTAECPICEQPVAKKALPYHWALKHHECPSVTERICPVCNVSGLASEEAWKNHLASHCSKNSSEGASIIELKSFEKSSVVCDSGLQTKKTGIQCRAVFCCNVIEKPELEDCGTSAVPILPLCRACRKRFYEALPSGTSATKKLSDTSVASEETYAGLLRCYMAQLNGKCGCPAKSCNNVAEACSQSRYRNHEEVNVASPTQVALKALELLKKTQTTQTWFLCNACSARSALNATQRSGSPQRKAA